MCGGATKHTRLPTVKCRPCHSAWERSDSYLSPMCVPFRLAPLKSVVLQGFKSSGGGNRPKRDSRLSGSLGWGTVIVWSLIVMLNKDAAPHSGCNRSARSLLHSHKRGSSWEVLGGESSSLGQRKSNLLSRYSRGLFCLELCIKQAHVTMSWMQVLLRLCCSCSFFFI